MPGPFLKKAAPILRVAALLYQVASVAAKVYGIPLPTNLPGMDLLEERCHPAIGKLVVYMGAVAMSSMRSKMDNMREEVDRIERDVKSGNVVGVQQALAPQPGDPTCASGAVYEELIQMLEQCEDFPKQPKARQRIGNLVCGFSRQGETVWMCEAHARAAIRHDGCAFSSTALTPVAKEDREAKTDAPAAAAGEFGVTFRCSLSHVVCIRGARCESRPTLAFKVGRRRGTKRCWIIIMRRRG